LRYKKFSLHSLFVCDIFIAYEEVRICSLIKELL
jgi:hypothetical protein